jgi:predicted TIM-barrel fold metal-dependent hydrolase
MDYIDVHAHGFPEAYLRRLAATYPTEVQVEEAAGDAPMVTRWSRAPLPSWDLPHRLEEMNRDKVAMEILSAPPVYSHLDADTAGFCRLLNDFQAEVVHAAPDRFRSFIHLPVHDVSASLQELSRWRGRAEVAGVLFGSNMGGVYPGDVSLLPIWEAIHAADLPVFIHPLAPCGYTAPVMPVILAFPGDTATAAAAIIYAGLFERFPTLKVILAHYGGGLASLARRLDMAVDIAFFPPGHGQNLPQPPSRYLARFYVDTAQGFHRPAFDCARTVFGIEHMVYGSDHFFHGSCWRAQLNEFLASLPLAPAEQRAIARGNAERLFPGLR